MLIIARPKYSQATDFILQHFAEESSMNRYLVADRWRSSSKCSTAADHKRRAAPSLRGKTSNIAEPTQPKPETPSIIVPFATRGLHRQTSFQKKKKKKIQSTLQQKQPKITPIPPPRPFIPPHNWNSLLPMSVPANRKDRLSAVRIPPKKTPNPQPPLSLSLSLPPFLNAKQQQR